MNSLSIVCLTLFALLGEPEQPVDFDTQIVSVLTKCGCNAGACHGAAAGRGGFRLSLLGSDAAADYQSIAKQFEGRRVNVQNPERSLIIRKSTEELSHSGGDALTRPAQLILQRWISEGARRNSSPQLQKLRVEPQSRIVETGQPIEVCIEAEFANQQPVDVTDWTLINSADPAAVEVHENQLVAHRSGRHVVIARYLNQVEPITIIVPFAADTPQIGSLPIQNFIDRHIGETMIQLNLPASPPARDQQWLRRTTLALTGQLPTSQHRQKFSAGLSDEQRVALVDEFLSSEQFTDYWTFRFARLLRLHSLPNEPEAHQAYGGWIRKQIAADIGWDEIVRQLLLATGDSHEIGAANYARMVTDARAHADFIGQSLAGIQLGCANCHNHPLDRWTQDDYHGLAAIFAPLERSRNVRFGVRGDVTNLRTREPALPRIPGVSYLEAGTDNRQRVVDWLVEPDQKLLARAMVNRLWQSMFGVGLVEPIDDLRSTNPASHPELLEELAADFAAHGYKIRHTLRTIALSATFARDSAIRPVDISHEHFYASIKYVRLAPEVLYDAIVQVTSSTDSLDVEPSSSTERAMLALDPSKPFDGLDQLGRCRRADGCGSSTTLQASLATQLHLINGPLVNARVADQNGALHRMLQQGRTNSEIINHFYQAALTRPPTDEQMQSWLAQIDQNSSQREQILEDFVWALLNSREFTHNH